MPLEKSRAREGFSKTSSCVSMENAGIERSRSVLCICLTVSLVVTKVVRLGRRHCRAVPSRVEWLIIRRGVNDDNVLLHHLVNEGALTRGLHRPATTKFQRFRCRQAARRLGTKVNMYRSENAENNRHDGCSNQWIFPGKGNAEYRRSDALLFLLLPRRMAFPAYENI